MSKIGPKPTFLLFHSKNQPRKEHPHPILHHSMQAFFQSHQENPNIFDLSSQKPLQLYSVARDSDGGCAAAVLARRAGSGRLFGEIIRERIDWFVKK